MNKAILGTGWKWKNPLGMHGGPPKTRPEERVSQGGGQGRETPSVRADDPRIQVGPDGRRYIELPTPGAGLVRHHIAEIPSEQFYQPQSNQEPQFHQQTYVVPSQYQPISGTQRQPPRPRAGQTDDSDANVNGGSQDASTIPPNRTDNNEIRPEGQEARHNSSILRYPDDLETSQTGSAPYYAEGQQIPATSHPVYYSNELIMVTRPSQALQYHQQPLPVQGPHTQSAPPAQFRDQLPSGNRSQPNTLQRKTVSYASFETERKMHQKALNEKDKTISGLRQEYATLEKNSTNLVKDNSILTEKNRSLSSENESYKSRNTSFLGEKRNLTDQLRMVKTEKKSALDEVDQLKQKQKADQKKIDHLDDVIKTLNSFNEGLEKEVTRLRLQVEGLRHDNDEIRSYVLKMESDLQPVRDEDYYIQLFEEIKSEVEMWSAKHGKSNAGATLSQESEDQLLDTIARLGNSGRASADFLIENPQFFRTWYSSARSLIQLIRHVIGVFLYDKIFEPFAAGLPSQFSQALVWIGNDVIQHEPQFSKTLMFHQALGLGAVRYVDNHCPRYNESIIQEMTALLSLLLPNVSSDIIGKAASKFITKGLALKAAITKEQAVYHGYCAYGGNDFDPESMHIASEETGPVYLCTFPGLARTIKKSEKESGKAIIRAVKASVVLQSALQPGKRK